MVTAASLVTLHTRVTSLFLNKLYSSYHNLALTRCDVLVSARYITSVLLSIMTLLLHFAFWPALVELLSKWMIYFHKSCKICNKTTNTPRQKMWHNARHMPLLLQQACNNYHNRLLTWKSFFEFFSVFDLIKSIRLWELLE